MSLVSINGRYGLGVIYDDSETESRIRWVIKPQFDKGFEWGDYFVVCDDGLWSIIDRELGVLTGGELYDFIKIKKNDNDFCLDCWDSNGNIMHFYLDGSKSYDEDEEDDNEYEDDDE